MKTIHFSLVLLGLVFLTQPLISATPGQIEEFRSRRKVSPQKTRVEDSCPKWSPAGDKIAFLSSRNSNNSETELFVVNKDGSGLKKIPEDKKLFYHVEHFTWSPDGKKIAFSAFSRMTETNTPEFIGDSLFIADLEKSEVYNISDGKFWSEELAWSPDGKILAFTKITNDRGQKKEIWLLGSDVDRKLAEGIKPVWAPDGKKICIRSEARPMEPEHIKIVDVATGKVRKYELVNEANTQYSLAFMAGIENIFWPPDGARVYAGDDNILACLNIASGEKDWRYAIDADEPIEYKQNSQSKGMKFSISHDGKQAAFLFFGEIWKADCTTGPVIKAYGRSKPPKPVNAMKITNEPGADKHSPSWAPDGKSLVFVKNREIWVISADGTGELRVSDAYTKALQALEEEKQKEHKEQSDKSKEDREKIFR